MFGLAYAMVILVEPLIDLVLLATAKSLKGPRGGLLVATGLYGHAGIR
jgi:glycine/serine hydroxymethyltransferase